MPISLEVEKCRWSSPSFWKVEMRTPLPLFRESGDGHPPLLFCNLSIRILWAYVDEVIGMHPHLFSYH